MAGDGAQALRRLESEPFDVVLMDGTPLRLDTLRDLRRRLP